MVLFHIWQFEHHCSFKFNLPFWPSFLPSYSPVPCHLDQVVFLLAMIGRSNLIDLVIFSVSLGCVNFSPTFPKIDNIILLCVYVDVGCKRSSTSGVHQYLLVFDTICSNLLVWLDVLLVINSLILTSSLV